MKNNTGRNTIILIIQHKWAKTWVLTYTKKWRGPWTKYKQNANLGNSYCSYKNLHRQKIWICGHETVSKYR